MPIVLRETALSYEERVAWLIENRGQHGVLDEIELIQSDFAQRVYSRGIAQTAEIAPADFDRLMRGAATTSAPTSICARRSARSTTRSSRRRAVRRAARGRHEPELRLRRPRAARARRPAHADTPEATTAYLDVAATIDSDFDLRTALHPSSRARRSATTSSRAPSMSPADEIDSDFDLRHVARRRPRRVSAHRTTLARAYTSRQRSIDSDFDHREALTTLRGTGRPHGRQAGGAARLGAGSRQRLRLRHVAGDRRPEATQRRLPSSPPTVGRCDTIGSDFDRPRPALVRADRRRRAPL